MRLPGLTETSTVGGARLMVTKLFAVMPQTSPRESSAVSTATPVAKRDAAWRKASGSARCIWCPYAVARTGAAGAVLRSIQAWMRSADATRSHCWSG